MMDNVFIKKSFFALLFLLIFFTLNNNTAHAQPQGSYCGRSGTHGQCGTDGGCAVGERCVAAGSGQYHCVQDNSCSCNASVCNPVCAAQGQIFAYCDNTGECVCEPGPTECGDPGTPQQCGSAGGCPNGSMCVIAGGEYNCSPRPQCSCGPAMCDPICTAQGKRFRQCSADGECICQGTGQIGDPIPTQYPGAGGGGLGGLPDYGDVSVLLTILRNILIPTGIIIGLVLIVSCGYSIMTSQGDPAKLKEAKECITSAIMGLIFIVLSVSILNLIIDSILGRT